ncbi:MAG TPA: SHOCT domain-containing protein [Trueperaceae bacterium]
MAYAFGYGHAMGFGFGFLNFIGTILFIVLIVWTIKFLVRGGRGSWRARGWERPGGGDPALAAARERFARSEIGSEEYEAISKGLRQDEDRRSGPSFGNWFDGRDRALELARMRFAKGEIGLEEFERIRKGLAG